MSRLFGTDGVRGLANETLTVELSVQLAQAAAPVLGAEALRPEESLSYSLGLVLQPVDRLYVTIDAYQIDIDDRIIQRANEREGAVDIAEKNIATFRRDCRDLHIKDYAAYTRATDFVAEQVAMIKELIAKGHAYVVNGEVFYEVGTFPAYGQLSGRKLDEQEVGASGRVEEDFSRKRNPADFTLWKPSTGNAPSWNTGEAAWPTGRPGWHIECSAMSTALLGAHFDVHGGGIDNMFPHHENEIAQSRCAHPEGAFARIWMHSGLLNIGGDKMSKSLGNGIDPMDWVRDYGADALRFTLARGANPGVDLPLAVDAAAAGRNFATKLWNAARFCEMNGIRPDPGFDPAGVKAEFFPDSSVEPNFIVNLGYGSDENLFPRSPRLDFEEAAQIL